MIVLGEHFGYKHSKNRFVLNEHNLKYCKIFDLSIPKSVVFNKQVDSLCFKFQKKDKKYQFETNYYIGVDWIVENELPIYIQPKLNTEDNEIDYLSMLFDALQEPENFEHLDDLYTIDFEAPLIEITQQQDKLTPLLLLEFLQLTKQIVRKGLKKSYYKITHNLNAKIKGKILVNATVKQNHSRHKMLYNVCQYQEFGYNSIENRILKKALLYTQAALNNMQGISNNHLKEVFHYVFPAFHLVNEDIDIRTLKNSKYNPLFKEYTQALKLAKLILQKYGYNITNTAKTKIKTPPFWIDMTKLFELYVFKKLREVFPLKDEVKYHYKTHYQELDYLINTKNGQIKMVVDAKYKNKYISDGIDKNDARQLSGYARLENVYKKLNIKNNQLIDCLIVYPNQTLQVENGLKNIINQKKEVPAYKYFYKIGIKLPEIECH